MRSTNSDGLGALSLISLSTVTEGFNHMLKSINTCDEAFVMIFLSSGLPGFGRGMESDVSVRLQQAFAQFLNTAHPATS